MTEYAVEREPHAPLEASVSLTHLAKTIRAYSVAILATMAAVAALSTIVSLAVYLMAPSQRYTTQPFRLTFDGATEGHFPNGRKFSPADIISVPILNRVFDANHLERFTTFQTFSSSIVVLESNRAYEQLSAEYQARLADPKLSSVDRDRLEKEYQLKLASLNKDEYAIGYYPFNHDKAVPPELVRKVLVDVLTSWADGAVREQQVLAYRVAVFSPTFVDESSLEQADYIVSTQMLRTKIDRIIDNIVALQQLPGSETARTKTDGVSLEELRLRLEDMLRFRIEPLIGVIRASGLVPSVAIANRFLESQLAYDQRQLKALQDEAETFRQTLAVYSMEAPATGSAETRTAAAAPKPASAQAGSETVMPQFTDTFLDRLVALTSHSENEQYRQKMATRYLEAAQRVVPAQQAVAYDQQALEEMRSTSNSGASMPATAIRTQIEQTRRDVRSMIVRTNEIYQSLSRNISPSTELFALTGTPVSRTARSRDLGRLALYDLLLTLASAPLAALVCLLHNRMREEEDEDALHDEQQAVAS
jgi:hypothetical protein